MEGKARIIRLVDKAIDYYVALRDKRCDAIAVRFDNHEEVPALIKCMEKFDTKRMETHASHNLKTEGILGVNPQRYTLQIRRTV